MRKGFICSCIQKHLEHFCFHPSMMLWDCTGLSPTMSLTTQEIFQNSIGYNWTYHYLYGRQYLIICRVCFFLRWCFLAILPLFILETFARLLSLWVGIFIIFQKENYHVYCLNVDMRSLIGKALKHVYRKVYYIQIIENTYQQGS